MAIGGNTSVGLCCMRIFCISFILEMEKNIYQAPLMDDFKQILEKKLF